MSKQANIQIKIARMYTLRNAQHVKNDFQKSAWFIEFFQTWFFAAHIRRAQRSAKAFLAIFSKTDRQI